MRKLCKVYTNKDYYQNILNKYFFKYFPVKLIMMEVRVIQIKPNDTHVLMNDINLMNGMFLFVFQNEKICLWHALFGIQLLLCTGTLECLFT